MNPTYAEVNLKYLQFNYNSIRKKTNTKIMAVVKADAYGHGMIECSNALASLNNKPEYYGVALLEEAVLLRKHTVIKEPILCFAPFDINDMSIYRRHKIIPSITSMQHIKNIYRSKINSKFRIHININTGMNRLGIGYKDAFNAVLDLSKNDKVIIDGIYTHFATSDEKNKYFANLQLQRFSELLKTLKDHKINYGLAHCANSGAILDLPHSYFDMVRPGISLYGYYPSQQTSESIRLKPVMSIISKLSTVYTIKKGEYVGYGRLFKAKDETECGTVSMGYADGLLRGLSNKIDVIIGDKKYSQIGRVSMDRISINLNKSKFRIGQKVILLGSSKNYKIDAWNWSNILKTIPYEITCGISKRVARKYVRKY